jgi:type I restriction enzyme S subunit
MCPEYVFFAFQCARFEDRGYSRHFQFVRRLMLPVAPLSEQRRIVARIDELFAEIAEGEATLERARQGLDTWRRALLKAAVTGELTRDWREANRPTETGADLLARIRAAPETPSSRSSRTRRPPAFGALAASSFSALPDGRAWATLGECISHLTSGSRDWSQYYDQGSAIFIMAQNIRPGCYNHNYVKHVAPPTGDSETTRTQERKNDLLVTIVGANTGDVCRVDFDADSYFVCQSVALVRPILSEMSEFLELYFVARDGGRGEFEKVIHGAGRPHLSFNQLLETPVPIPSLVEMREIVQRVRQEEEAAFSEQEFAGFHRDLLALRQSILKAAFEGRLVPQDPADEPASALLARLHNGYSSNGARRRRARATPDSSHPSLPGLTRQSVDPRVKPAGDE